MNVDPAVILRRSLHIDREIKDLQLEQKQLEDNLACLQGFDFGKPIVKSTSGRGSVEALAIQAADGKERIARKIARLMAAKQQARELIETLPDGPERNVLVQRYILLRTWEQIAVDLDYSYRHVIRLHGLALQKLRGMS